LPLAVIEARQALPNAAFVAFIGTPLLKDDKTTNKFGPIVHAYTMRKVKTRLDNMANKLLSSPAFGEDR